MKKNTQYRIITTKLPKLNFTHEKYIGLVEEGVLERHIPTFKKIIEILFDENGTPVTKTMPLAHEEIKYEITIEDFIKLAILLKHNNMTYNLKTKEIKYG